MSVGQIPEKVSNYFYKLIAEAPTTNIRILVTLALVIGTAIKHWSSDTWNPDWNWLIFLMAMSGLDVLQHFAKRKTAWHPATVNGNGGPTEEEEEQEPSESEIG